MLTHEAIMALKRPKNYRKLSAREQWEIDKRLGILDWNPSRDELVEFIREWKEKYK